MARALLLAFFLSFATIVSNAFARFAYALVLPAMRGDLGWTWAQSGLLNTWSSAGYLTGAVLARMLVVRTGNRRLFQAGMLLTALSILATGFTRSFELLAFARFVAERYDDLTEYDAVAFVQGDPNDHLDKISETASCIPSMLERAANHNTVVPLGEVVACDGQGRPHHPGLPVEAAFLQVFAVEDPPPQYVFAAGAQYAVPVSALLSRPKNFWQRLHSLLFEEMVDAWSMERLWPFVFRITNRVP